MRKRVLRIAYAVLLLVVTTFAWILTGDIVKVDKLKVDYSHGTLFIANVNVEASLLVYDEQAKDYKNIQQIETESGEKFVLGGKSLVPGSAIAFKLRLKNTTGNATQTNLTMYMAVPESAEEKMLLEGTRDDSGNITKEGLLSKLFIEIKPGTGYYGTAVDSLYIRFDDADRVTVDGIEQYALGLYSGESKLTIPNVDENSIGVELECSIYFDEEADYTYQDIGFIIDYFRMEQ